MRRAKVNRLGRHILLTGSSAAADPAPNPPASLYSGYVDISDRQTANLPIAVSPDLLPGLVVGDFLFIGSDYTGTLLDPYPGATGTPADINNYVVFSPVGYNVFAPIYAANPLFTTGTVNYPGTNDRDGTTLKIYQPENLSGTDGGRCLIEVLPESTTAYGTYIIRIYRIVTVPEFSGGSYVTDLYELGFTVGDALLATWAAQ
jgi:hypothetical protein